MTPFVEYISELLETEGEIETEREKDLDEELTFNDDTIAIEWKEHEITKRERGSTGLNALKTYKKDFLTNLNSQIEQRIVKRDALFINNFSVLEPFIMQLPIEQRRYRNIRQSRNRKYC